MSAVAWLDTVHGMMDRRLTAAAPAAKWEALFLDGTISALVSCECVHIHNIYIYIYTYIYIHICCIYVYICV